MSSLVDFIHNITRAFGKCGFELTVMVIIDLMSNVEEPMNKCSGSSESCRILKNVLSCEKKQKKKKLDNGRNCLLFSDEKYE